MCRTLQVWKSESSLRYESKTVDTGIGADPVQRGLQSCGNVGIRRLIEADVAIADLYEAEA